MKQEIGTVYLVGAGPGDQELLTIKANRLINEAEVVVYDQLVGDAILSMIPDTAKKIDVGKRAGNHTKSQEEINEILCQEALAGKMVVRLKGGDPFLFGRGGEEINRLAEEGIPYEVVPGVTSAIAVPAYSGIPVTHRDYASSFHVITGHKRKGEKLSLPFKSYVQSQGTLVFLMGLSALPEIVTELRKAGMEETMPVAVIQKGCTAGQKKVISDLSHIVEQIKQEEITTPAMIVVGHVCQLAEDFSWYEKFPLFGNKIYVTRPKDRSFALTQKLRGLGAEVVEFPSIQTVKRSINSEMETVYHSLYKYQYLLFTSPYGVKVFFEHLKELHLDIRSIGGAKIGAIGSATKREIESHGILVDYMPEQYSGEEFGNLIGQVCKDEDQILIPRSAIGNPELISKIKDQKNVEIVDFPIYDTEYLENHTVQILEKEPIVFFTSASTVKGFTKAQPNLDFEKIQAFCIGEQTGDMAKQYGMHIFIAEHATIEGLIELAKDKLQHKK